METAPLTKLIKYSVKLSKKHRGKNFPRMPKIVVFLNDWRTKFKIKEINPGHTQSVMRGYSKRLMNHVNQFGTPIQKQTCRTLIKELSNETH